MTDTETLERRIVAQVRIALGSLLDAAGDLDAALDGVTDEFDTERTKLTAAIRSAQSVLEGAQRKRSSPLPPDPEGMNDKRSVWADGAITAFQEATGADDEDALSDLLADLMHWADRHRQDFDAALDHGRWHYQAETGGEDGL